MKRVAIIGSGPAGLTCAEQLAKEGFKATVFDYLKEFGGMLAYGVPEFRIPLDFSRKRVVFLKKKGVEFRQERVVSVRALLKEFGGEFDFVVLAIGAGEGSKAGFVGEENKCVIDALDFLAQYKLYGKSLLSKKESVAIIGGGNAAIDAARTAIRQCKEVTILYRRTENEMPALKNEIAAAKKEGVKIDFLVAPKEFLCEEKDCTKAKKQGTKVKPDKKQNTLICSEMVLGERDSSARRKPIDSGNIHSYSFDRVIMAVGQSQDLAWLKKEGIGVVGSKVIVGSDYKTSLDSVYACGDCVSGAKTIGEATKTGLAVAKVIISKFNL